PGAVPVGDGRANLVPLAQAGMKIQLTLSGTGRSQVTLFDQGQVQILQAAVAGLSPKMPYVLGLSSHADGSGVIQPLAKFMTNPAGGAIVNTLGPLRQIVSDAKGDMRRYLVIAPGDPMMPGAVVQVQK
ncbi:MAG: hypothetical protein EOP17_05395, partial [Rhizobiaceae bacterium]